MLCPLLSHGPLNLLQLLICFFLAENQVTRTALPSFSGWQRTCGKLFLFKSSVLEICIWPKFSSSKAILPLLMLKAKLIRGSKMLFYRFLLIWYKDYTWQAVTADGAKPPTAV